MIPTDFKTILVVASRRVALAKGPHFLGLATRAEILDPNDGDHPAVERNRLIAKIKTWVP